jgi:hypothetical protein
MKDLFLIQKTSALKKRLKIFCGSVQVKSRMNVAFWGHLASRSLLYYLDVLVEGKYCFFLYQQGFSLYFNKHMHLCRFV